MSRLDEIKKERLKKLLKRDEKACQWLKCLIAKKKGETTQEPKNGESTKLALLDLLHLGLVMYDAHKPILDYRVDLDEVEAILIEVTPKITIKVPDESVDTGKKKAECDICGAKKLNISQLIQHIRLIHGKAALDRYLFQAGAREGYILTCGICRYRIFCDSISSGEPLLKKHWENKHFHWLDDYFEYIATQYCREEWIEIQNWRKTDLKGFNRELHSNCSASSVIKNIKVKEALATPEKAPLTKEEHPTGKRPPYKPIYWPTGGGFGDY